MLSHMDQTIPRSFPLKTQAPLTSSKVAQRVSEEKIARQLQLEEEEIKWEKNCIRKPVRLNEKTIKKLFWVTMAFGEAFVKELKRKIVWA